MDQQTIEQYNAEVKKWGIELRYALRARIGSLGIKGKTEMLKQARTPEAISALQKRIEEEGSLIKNLYAAFRQQDGEIFQIGIKFPRSGVWVQKGVANRHPKTNPRRLKDWFNSSLDERLPVLADLVVKYKADKAVNAIMAERMKID